MKASIHPQFYTNTAVTCACGNSFTTESTQETIYTEICSNCHPFYTGKQKLIDSTGNVDKFKKRMEVAALAQQDKKEKKPRKSRVTKGE